MTTRGRRRRRNIPFPPEVLSMLRAIDRKKGPFICFNCNKNYKYYCDLTRHVKYECVNRVKNFACTLCDKRYYRQSHLTTHLQKHYRHDPATMEGGHSFGSEGLCEPGVIYEPEIELGDYEVTQSGDLDTYVPIKLERD